MAIETTFLRGTLSNLNDLTGTLSEPINELSGELSLVNDFEGSLSNPSDLTGQLSDEDSELIGFLSSPLMVLSGALSNPETLDGTLSNAILRGYSAYQIAVMAGYEGTVEEWLDSLAADKIEIRNNNGVVEYKYESQSAWTVLIDLSSYSNDYNILINKPSLDGDVLIGDRDLTEKYVQNVNALSNMELEELLQ